MMINLGALEKDRAGLDTGLLTIARNCYPKSNGWMPAPCLVEAGPGALPAKCIGLWFVKSKTGAYQVFAATATKLYKRTPSGWTDYTRGIGTTVDNYATVDGAIWQGVQFGSLFILVNATDEPQVIDVDSGATEFANLAGSPPVSKYIGVVGDFVFLIDATDQRRGINCGTTGPNTATSWTVGTDLCDEYIAPDGGTITSAPMLGEYGVIMQSDGLARRVILQPGDPYAAFRFEKLEGIKGSLGGYSTVAASGRLFYLAEDGIYSLSPDGQNTPVGEERINQDFRDNSDQARLDQVIAFADPYSSRIYWAYYSSAAATDYDRLLGYDWLRDRLFYIHQTAQFWAPVALPGTALDDLDAIYASIDDMTVSLDSRLFQGGRPTIGAINGDSKLALLAGENLTATVRVSGLHLVPPERALLDEAYVIGRLGTATVSLMVGKSESPGEPPTWVGPFTRSPRTGKMYPRASARIHTLELTIEGSWTDVSSIGTKEQPDGEQ